MASLHHAYHFTGFYDHVPNQSDPALRILFGQQGSAAENKLWYDKLAEVIDGYQPDLVWQDFNLGQVQETYRLQFLAHYYNQAVAWNKDVVATYKDGLNNRGEVYDFERGRAGRAAHPLLADRRQHLLLQLVLHGGHRLPGFIRSAPAFRPGVKRI